MAHGNLRGKPGLDLGHLYLWFFGTGLGGIRLLPGTPQVGPGEGIPGQLFGGHSGGGLKTHVLSDLFGLSAHLPVEFQEGILYQETLAIEFLALYQGLFLQVPVGFPRAEILPPRIRGARHGIELVLLVKKGFVLVKVQDIGLFKPALHSFLDLLFLGLAHPRPPTTQIHLGLGKVIRLSLEFLGGRRLVGKEEYGQDRCEFQEECFHGNRLWKLDWFFTGWFNTGCLFAPLKKLVYKTSLL